MTYSLNRLVSTFVLALCGVVGSSHAASGVSFVNVGGAAFDTGGVFVTGDVFYTATDDDGGGVDRLRFLIFDDGEIKFEQTFQLAVGLSASFHFDAFYPGLLSNRFPGVGLYLDDIPNRTSDDRIDPFFPTRYADPSECRVDCGPVAAIPEPSEYALMLMGLGVVGWVARRRARTVV